MTDARAAADRLRILASAGPGEVRVALLRDGRLLEFWLERPALPDGVGDLHLARVSAVAPAMAGAFMTMADGATGFLPEREAAGSRDAVRLHEGMLLPVRVIRAAQGGKGPRLSARLSTREAALAAGTDGPRLLARGPGHALRLALAHPRAPLEVDQPALAARLRGRLGKARVALRPPPLFDEAMEAELDALTGPEVALSGGAGRLLVHPTPALTAIDVDAGAAAGAGDPTAHLRLNLLAVDEAARQIRLRNLGGPILIDLAGLTAKRRAALETPFARALAGDALAQLKGLGPLGLFEVQRRRIHPPLHEVTGGGMAPLTLGLRALRVAAREVAAAPNRSLGLRAAPAVTAALRRLPDALDAFREHAGRPLTLLPDPAVALGAECIEEVAAHAG
jgi:Ribonuclease G/E